MKKKILIALGILILLVIISLLVTYYIFKAQEKQRIEELKNSLKFFSNNQILEKTSNDELKEYFNNILKVNKEIEELNKEEYYKQQITLETIDPEQIIKTKDQIIKEINNKKELLQNFKLITEKNNLEKQIKNYKDNEKKTIFNIFEKNQIIKGKQNQIKILEEYLSKLSEIKEFTSFLEENKENYYIKKSVIYYKKDEFKEKYDLLKKEFDFEIKKVVPEKPKKILPVLMYHGVLDNPWGSSSLFVRVNELKEQMEYLKNNGYTTLFVSEIYTAKNYEKPIIITFDDGYRDLYTYAFSIIKNNQIKVNIYAITDWLDTEFYLTQSMVSEMSSSSYVEFGSHTKTHPSLASLTEEQIEIELKESKEALENITGKNINSIAYPKGSFDSRVVNISKKYYNFGLSTISGFENALGINSYAIKRLAVYRGNTINSFKSLIN